MLRSDFFYGYSKEKSALLYCSMNSPLPNIFSSAAFKKHTSFLLDQNELKAKYSEMFLFFPATLDRKEEFLQWKDNIHLHPIDISLDDLKEEASLTSINSAIVDVKVQRNFIVRGY